MKDVGIKKMKKLMINKRRKQLRKELIKKKGWRIWFGLDLSGLIWFYDI